MLLENDKLQDYEFNEIIKYLDSLNSLMLDYEFIEKANDFIKTELTEKGDKKLFSEILPSITIKEEDVLNNKNFIDNYFEEFGFDAYNSWGPSSYSKSLTSYRFKFEEFKNYAWFLRRSIYYKILKEDLGNELFLEFIKLNLDKEELEELSSPQEDLNFIFLSKKDREQMRNKMKSGNFYISNKMYEKYKFFFKKYFIVRESVLTDRSESSVNPKPKKLEKETALILK
jgi:hypothetical protein